MITPEIEVRLLCENCKSNQNQTCNNCKGTKFITKWIPLQKEYIGWGSQSFKAVYIIPFEIIATTQH